MSSVIQPTRPDAPPHRFGSVPAALWAAAAGLALVGPAPAAAQGSAAEIFDTSRARYEERVRGVSDYTLVQQIEGAEQVAYFERRERDGRTVFVPAGPFKLALLNGDFEGTPLEELAREGGVLPAVRDAMLGAAADAGLEELKEAVRASSEGQLADLIGPLLVPADEGGVTATGAGASERISLAALLDTDRLKGALIEGAARAGLDAAARSLLGAPGQAVTRLLDVLRGKAGPGDVLGALGGLVAGGDLPLPGGGLLPGAGADVMAAASGAGAGQRVLGSAASAGLGALAGYGLRSLGRSALGAVDRAATTDPFAFDAWDLLERMEGRAELQGTERIDGHDSWVLVVEDARGLDLADPDELRDASLTLWWDQELYVPRQIELSGHVRGDDEWVPVTLRTSLLDYRDSDGLVVPFRTITVVEGLGTQLSDEEREKYRKQLAELEEQMAEIPPEQRAMVEGMMGAQMPRLEAMLSEESERIETVVTELRVNEGPPTDLLEERRRAAR